MFFDEKLYVPGDFNDEVFLTDFPIEIIEDSIKSQFKNPFEFRNRDYIQTFVSQYEYSINNCNENEAETLEEYHDTFIQFILKLFHEKLGISIPNIEDKVDSELHEMIHIVYRFFIMNIKRNFINYIYNYIYENKGVILEIPVDKRKDVTTNSFKEDIGDEYDILILSNLPKIVGYVLDNIQPASDFLRLCVDERPCLETSFVTEKFNSYEITGNFSETYALMIGEDEKSDIVSAIRSRILNKYPNRYAVLNPNESPETTEE